MQPYKGYFIEGSALIVHPFSPDWNVGGSVLVPGRSSSIVEITRFQLQRFTVSIKELAEWFGLEVARLVGGRMPASPTELNGPNTCPKCNGFGNRGPRTEGQDARAGDQWTMREMWLSPCVGIGSWEDDTPPARGAVLPSRD
jgi:hypothetical protein